MKKGLTAFGIIVIIIGIMMAILMYPLIGYASASETSDELSEFSLGSILGKEVKMRGTVETIWTDYVPYLDVVFDLIGFCVISIEGLEVTSILSDFWDTDQTYPVIIFSDNTDLSEGDEVTVEGYGFGLDAATFIIGESGLSTASSILLMSSPPESAKVEKVPQPGFWAGIGVLALGFILMIVGLAQKEGETVTSGQPPAAQMAHQQQYPAQQPAYHQPVAQQPPTQQSYQQPQYKQPHYQQMPVQQSYPCLTCGQVLLFDNQYQRWYCNYCKRYL